MDATVGTRPGLATRSTATSDENNDPDPSAEPSLSTSAERWVRTPHARGRQARDPQARSIQHQASSMESMEAILREELANPTGPAEHTTVEFTFPTSAAFMVYSGDFRGSQEAYKAKSHLYNSLSRSAVSVVDALSQDDPKEALRKQKAIAKAIVDSVQKVDGYRYSFHNNWVSKEDSACRFSYYCNDSTLNKGRAANEGASMVGKRKIKPVYDCKGQVWIKFSVTYQKLEVHYKHVPLHKTYEERAPPPRKDSKRRKIMEIFTPELLPRPGRRKRDSSSRPELDRRTRKRRATEPPPDTPEASSNAQDHSLAPLQDFLSPTEGVSNEPAQLESAIDAENVAPPDAPIFTVEKLQQLKDSYRAGSGMQGKLVKRKSNTIPGTMTGYMAGDLMVWDEKGMNGRRKPNKSRGNTVILEPLQAVAAALREQEDESSGQQAPSSSTSQPNTSMSEMEMLRAKLAEAEQRIQKLEAEKVRPMGPPGWPPAKSPAPASQYGYPSQGYSSYPQPPYQYPAPTSQQDSSLEYPPNGLPSLTNSYPPPESSSSRAAAQRSSQGSSGKKTSKTPGFRGFKLFQPSQ